MFLLTPKFISLKSLQPLRFYKKLDGWLLGSGKPIRIKTKKKEIWIKHSSKNPWIINPLVSNGQNWQLLCIFCGANSDILYFTSDYRCRNCTNHKIQKRNIPGLITAKRQASVGDYSMLTKHGTERIAMRMHLESEGIVAPLLSPVPEEEAIKQIRYEKCIEHTPTLEPIKYGRLIWVSHRYIWVDGQT
jgi:hypothetical protein|tara:strand:+ start:589 stop:1155 length:567 start_codon:yes stop_codon:yes gene_type:complete